MTTGGGRGLGYWLTVPANRPSLDGEKTHSARRAYPKSVFSSPWFSSAAAISLR